MRAVRLHAYHQDPVVEEVPEPAIAGPLDVVVKVGGAGVCRTDLHIMEGQWDAAMSPKLPYTIGGNYMLRVDPSRRAEVLDDEAPLVRRAGRAPGEERR